MGILSKLANSMTGGGATLSLDWSAHGAPGETTIFVLRAQIGPDDLNVRDVVIRLRAMEGVRVPWSRIRAAFSSGVKMRGGHFTMATPMLDRAFSMTGGPALLQAQQEYSWEMPYTFSPNIMPTFQMPHTRHYWTVEASLVMSGADPRTGPHEVMVYASTALREQGEEVPSLW